MLTLHVTGRRRLEPVGVLVFSIIMITAFFQVALEGIQKLGGSDHAIVSLTVPAIVIMAATVCRCCVNAAVTD